MKYLSFLICLFTIISAKSQIKIDNAIARYESMEQLDALYKQYGTMVIVNNYIFQMPCDCYCRDMGGNSENRNLGGNTENRNLSGNTEDRNLGGNQEERNLGGNMENRDLGGNTENRDLAGNTENRNLGGNQENRNLGGNMEDRSLGGNTENRDLGGNKENRNLGGQISSFTCYKDESGDFFFSGINPDVKLLLYDGVYLEEIPDKIKKVN
jgi:hypothetical protein